jgi:hypothetical protein
MRRRGHPKSINAQKMQASEKILYKCEKEGLQKVSKRRRGPPKSIQRRRIFSTKESINAQRR